MKHAFFKILFILSLACLAPSHAHAQKDQYLRTNPKFIQTFREVVAKPSASTVRILCDGKETALGMVVGEDGWILTKANDLKVPVVCKLKDGREFEAKIVGVHKDHDLAMLKIDAKKLKPVAFASSKGLSAGSWVACAGLKEDPVAIGVISVGTRNVMNKGPTVTFDTTKSGFLGVNLESAEGGVKIAGIEPKSAADQAGLKVDDIIIALGNKNITDVEPFILEIGKRKPGDVIDLKIRRDEEELEIKATLGKRPARLSRGDFQNKMGSELSSRRSGYPTILQHDSVVKPADCGGPIVDLDGHVLGINICRAGRTESWAVPSEVLQTVLADLKSGKLAPPRSLIDPPAKEEKAKLARPEETTKAVQQLLGLMKKRLDLSVEVARTKYANKMGIADSKREEKQLARLVEAADDIALDKNFARTFFNAQFAASRQLQEELHARWKKDDKAPSAGNYQDLKKSLRPKLDEISTEMLDVLVRLEPSLHDAKVRQEFRQQAAEILQGENISEPVRAKALEGWIKK